LIEVIGRKNYPSTSLEKISQVSSALEDLLFRNAIY